MAYYGKEFVLDRQENFIEFLDSIKLDVPTENRNHLINFKPVTKIEKNGDEYTITSSKPDGGTSRKTFKNGVEYEENNYGKTAKIVATVNGDTVTQVQTYPDVIITYKIVFTPNEFVATVTSNKWDGVAKRYYKAK